MPFRFLEHTADVRAECEAATFDGLLEEAAHALYATALTHIGNARSETRAFVLCAASREERLIRWLQEWIFLLETERFVAVHFTFEPMDDDAVSIRASGYLCSEDDRAMEIKSATYHGLEVEQSETGWSVRVVFDV